MVYVVIGFTHGTLLVVVVLCVCMLVHLANVIIFYNKT